MPASQVFYQKETALQLHSDVSGFWYVTLSILVETEALNFSDTSEEIFLITRRHINNPQASCDLTKFHCLLRGENSTYKEAVPVPTLRKHTSCQLRKELFC
jgi:hypothetical protein